MVNNVSFISYTFKCYNRKHISIKYISIGKQCFVHIIYVTTQSTYHIHVNVTIQSYNTKHISIKYISIGKQCFVHIVHISMLQYKAHFNKIYPLINNVSFISYIFKCYNRKHISIKYISIVKQRFAHIIYM